MAGRARRRCRHPPDGSADRSSRSPHLARVGGFVAGSDPDDAFTAAAAVIVGAIAGAVAAEAAVSRRGLGDGSAVVTGVIVALLLPATTPAWLAAATGAIAIGLGTAAWGGLGKNPFNPAALARVVAMAVAPSYMFAPVWR